MSAKIERPLYVLDTWALLALFWSEPGWKVVQAALGESAVSAISLTETITTLRKIGQTQATVPLFRDQSLEVKDVVPQLLATES